MQPTKLSYIYRATFAIIALLYASVLNSATRKTVNLNILTDDGEQFKQGELLITQNDSTILFEIIRTPQQIIELAEDGKCELTLTSHGYYQFETIIPDSTYIRIDATLERESSTLGELEVKGYSRSEKTATGEIFTLSKKAKDCKNPYLALSEIPLLQVDVANQDVKLRDGTTPLVLIDGKMVNTGITPIDPRFIEKVEITEVVSAKYMNQGITKIIDIKLKRDIPMYLFTELRTRHDLPLREGFGGGTFEIGTKNIALYGRVFEEYTYKNRTDVHSDILLNESTKRLYGTNRNWSNSITGNITLKWVPKPSDYFAFLIMGRNLHTKMKGKENGSYENDKKYTLIGNSNNKSTAKPINTAIFYEHTFKENSTLSALARYQRSWGMNHDSYEETIENSSSCLLNFQKNIFENYNLTLDYNGSKKKFGSIAAGNELNYTSNRLRNHNVTPIEKAQVQYWNNYTYLTYSNSWKSLYYMASAGLMYMDINANGKRNSYWRPKISASLSTSIPSGDYIRADYQLQNGNPSMDYVFVFNNSTNPWIRYEGNPYLVPIMKHSLNLNYFKMIKSHYLIFNIKHVRTNHIFEKYMRNDGDYMIQSYRNHGMYNGTNLSAQFIGRFNSIQGAINPTYNWDKYVGQHTKGSVGISGYLRWDFNRFFLFANLSWQNKAYDEISTTRYENPIDAHLSLFWRVTDHIQLAVGLPYFWGIRSNTVTVKQDGYLSRTKTKYKGQSLHPWLLFSWTIYKNRSQSIEDKISSRAGSL